MTKAHYEIVINAPREKVWHAMLDDATYREWTKAFNATSHFEGDWSEGSKIIFRGTDENGSGDGGMVSRIAKNVPNEFLSIEHIGILKDGIEDTSSPEATKWTPAFENYTFKEHTDGTELHIDMDIAEDYKEEFDGMWPKALARLKEIAESA